MEDEKKGQIISRNTDLIVSILTITASLAIHLTIFSIAIRELNDFQAVLVALFSVIVGFAVIVFAGRYVEVIGESTFYKLFLRLIDQIPLISNLVDRIGQFIGKQK